MPWKLLTCVYISFPLVTEGASCSVPVDPPLLCANDSGTGEFSCSFGYNYSNDACTGQTKGPAVLYIDSPSILVALLDKSL